MDKTEKSKVDSKTAPKPPKSPVELLKEYRFKLNLLQIQHRMGNLSPHQTYHLQLLRKEIARLLTKIRSSQAN